LRCRREQRTACVHHDKRVGSGTSSSRPRRPRRRGARQRVEPGPQDSRAQEGHHPRERGPTPERAFCVRLPQQLTAAAKAMPALAAFLLRSEPSVGIRMRLKPRPQTAVPLLINPPPLTRTIPSLRISGGRREVLRSEPPRARAVPDRSPAETAGSTVFCGPDGRDVRICDLAFSVACVLPRRVVKTGAATAARHAGCKEICAGAILI
jgi:hypothetical protein